MVGVVIVSHSRKIAEGIKDLAEQMVGKQLKIIAAGGIGNDELGTDAVKISKAILGANTGDGVVVLADLGSAILSAQTAMELLDDHFRSMVKIADAPIVEGAIIAAVQAFIGSSLDELIVATEAVRGMMKL